MLIVLTTLLDTLSSMVRSRAVLALENLALRHQIGVLRRSARKRCQLTPARRYMRLEFDYKTPEDIDDDELWEKAKKLPIDPNNQWNRLNRLIRETGVARDPVRRAKLIEEIEEARNKKLLSKEELLERIREYENREP